MSNSIVIKEPKPAVEEKSASQKENADIVALVKTQNDIIAQNNKMMTALMEASKANAIQQEKNSKINNLQRQLSEARLQRRVENIDDRVKNSDENKSKTKSAYDKTEKNVDGTMGSGFTSSMLMSALTMGAINPAIAKSLKLPQLAGGAINAGVGVVKKIAGFLSLNSEKTSGTTSSNDAATKNSKILKKVDTIINLLEKDSEGGSAEPKTKKGIFSKIFEILKSGLGLFGDTLTGLIKTGLLVVGAKFVYDLIKGKLEDIAKLIFGDEAIETLKTTFKNEGLWGTVKLGSEKIFTALSDLMFGKEGTETIKKAYKDSGALGAIGTTVGLLTNSIGGLIFGESWAEIQKTKEEKGLWEAFKLGSATLFKNTADFIFGDGTFEDMKATFDKNGAWGVISEYSVKLADKIGTFLLGQENWEKTKASFETDGVWNSLGSTTGKLIKNIGEFFVGKEGWAEIEKKHKEKGTFKTVVDCVGTIIDGIGTFIVGEKNWNGFKTKIQEAVNKIDEFFTKYIMGFINRVENAIKIYNTSIELSGNGLIDQATALKSATKAITSGMTIDEFYEEQLNSTSFYKNREKYRLEYKPKRKLDKEINKLVNVYHNDPDKFKSAMFTLIKETNAIPWNADGTIAEGFVGKLSDLTSKLFGTEERYENLQEMRYIMASALKTIEDEKSAQLPVKMETQVDLSKYINNQSIEKTQYETIEAMSNLNESICKLNNIQNELVEQNRETKQYPQSIISINNSHTQVNANPATSIRG